MNSQSGQGEPLAQDDKGPLVNKAEAEEEFKAALSLRPDSAEALGNLGSIYYELGDYDQSVQHLLHAVDLQPGNQDFLKQLAYAYPDSSFFTDSVEKIKSLIERQNKRSQAYELLHLTYWRCCVKSGETSTALESMRQYVNAPATRGKTYARKLLAALEVGPDNFLDALARE